ncbi:hypothetical protein N9W43_07065 [Litoricolaceae bacterium]|nr:hypothetical protein [Litorivicinaceae bacterium]MDB2425540.1 hypothetical protein [Litorivicinaceae bacterium]
MDLLGFLKIIQRTADTAARDLPVDGQQLLMVIGGAMVVLVLLLLLMLLRRLRTNRKNAHPSDSADNKLMLARSLEELALDAEALEELYHKGYISADLFLDEAAAYKRHADLLHQYLQIHQK